MRLSGKQYKSAKRSWRVALGYSVFSVQNVWVSNKGQAQMWLAVILELDRQIGCGIENKDRVQGLCLQILILSSLRGDPGICIFQKCFSFFFFFGAQCAKEESRNDIVPYREMGCGDEQRGRVCPCQAAALLLAAVGAPGGERGWLVGLEGVACTHVVGIHPLPAWWPASVTLRSWWREFIYRFLRAHPETQEHPARVEN